MRIVLMVLLLLGSAEARPSIVWKASQKIKSWFTGKALRYTGHGGSKRVPEGVQPKAVPARPKAESPFAFEGANGALHNGTAKALLQQRKARPNDVLGYARTADGKVKIWSEQRKPISIQALRKAGFDRVWVGGDTVLVRNPDIEFSTARVRKAGLSKTMEHLLATVPTMEEYRSALSQRYPLD